MSKYNLQLAFFQKEDKEVSEELHNKLTKVAFPLNKDKVFKGFNTGVYLKKDMHKLIPGMIARNSTGFKYEEDEVFYVFFLLPDLADESEGLDIPVFDPDKSIEDQEEMIESWFYHCQNEWFMTNLKDSL